MEETQVSQTKNFDSFIAPIVMIVLFLLPVFFVPGNFISLQYGTSMLFAGGVIISLLLFLIGRFKMSSLSIPTSTRGIVALTAVPVTYILSFLAHGVSRISFFGYTFDLTTVGFMTLAFLFMFLVISLFQKSEKIFYAYLAVIASLILVAVFVAVRFVFGPSFLSFGTFLSVTDTPIGSINSTSIFFGIGAILSLLTLEMLSLTKLVKWVTTLALVVSLIFLSVINFQIVWIILAITSLVFLVFKMFSDGSVSIPSSVVDKLKRAPRITLIIFAISVVSIFFGGKIGGTMATKLGISSIDVRPTLAVTYNIAKSTLSNNPFFGSGPNTFGFEWSSYRPLDINTSVFWNTDFAYGVGILPTLAVTTGAIGVIAWIIFFWYFFSTGFRMLFNKEMDPFARYLSTSSFFIAMYLWIMALVYVPTIVLFIFTFFFTGVFFASAHSAGMLSMRTISFGDKPRFGFIYTLGLVSLFVVLLSLGYGLYTSGRSLWYFSKSAYAINNTGNVVDAENYMKKAIDLVPYDVYYRSQADISIAKINTLLSQDLSKANKDEVQKFFIDELGRAIESGLNAVRQNDKNYLNYITLGRAYEIGAGAGINIQGAYENALLAYTKAFERNPNNPAINLLLARLEASRNELQKAKQYTLAAIAQKQNYADAYYFLSQLEVADKNLKGAIDSVQALSIIDPTNPGVFFQLGLLKYNAQDFEGAIVAFRKSLELAPDYANSKYFLGLSYVITNNIPLAIQQFEELRVTNPDNKEVNLILTNLKAGKSPFANAQPPIDSKPEKRKIPPVTQEQ